MIQQKDGGPAFPVPAPRVDSGMSLRDYFAGQALQAMATASNSNPNTILPTAQNAYRWADAMLKARAQ